MGIVVALLVVAVGQSFTSVPMLFAKPSYYGQFTDSGGLHKGDRVRIAGLGVGTVEGLKIDGDHIVVKFSIGTNTRTRVLLAVGCHGAGRHVAGGREAIVRG